ncbi:MAG: nucleoside-diphosphate sugar epimerase/dehydratase, partial [Ginsengibacter sp.]
MAKPLPIVYYALGDFIAACISWTLIYYIYLRYHSTSFHIDTNYFISLTVYSIFWLILYHLFGAYKNIYYKSRLNEMIYTFVSTVTGGMLLLVIFILYNNKIDYTLFYKAFFYIALIQFFITYLGRSLLLSKAHAQLQKQQVCFNTLIIGSSEIAVELYRSITTNIEKTGYRICGFLSIGPKINSELNAYTAPLGTISNTLAVIDNYNVKEVIIAI